MLGLIIDIQKGHESVEKRLNSKVTVSAILHILNLPQKKKGSRPVCPSAAAEAQKKALVFE